MYCDLHTHSTASDGGTPPRELPAQARAAGLAALALTDHDTTAGLPACAAAAGEVGVCFVPGIELSANRAALKPAPYTPAPGDRLGTLHLLGLFIRHDDPGLAALCRDVAQARAQRNPQIIARLNEMGLSISYDEVLALVQAQGGQVIGRPHIGQVLVAKGYAASVQDAFARYIGEGRPAYVRKDLLPPGRAIDAIHKAGGLAILAHPIQMRCADAAELEYTVKRLAEMDLDGLEVWHCDHGPAEIQAYAALAQRLGLLVSGGSDYHGPRKAVALGSQQVPVEVFEALRDVAGL